MVGQDEMAIGIASALAGVAIDPLTVQLRGMAFDDAVYLVRAVLRECADAGSLRHIQVDPELFVYLTSDGGPALPCAIRSGGQAGEVLFSLRG